VIVLTPGSDDVTLTNESEVIATLGGNNRVYAQGGNDKVIGGAGNDSLYGGAGNDALYGNNSSDYLEGGDGNDTLVGGEGSDAINGGPGDDEIVGGSGNDVLNPGSGRDSVFGQDGDDSIQVFNSPVSSTSINGGDGTDRVDISYSGISGLGDFALSLSADELSLTDKNGGVITLRSIEDLRVNGKQYVGYLGNYTFDVRSPGYGGKVIWSATESTVFALPGSVFYAGSGWLGTLVGFSRFIGSQGQDTINFNVDRSIFSASYSFNLGAGDDTMLSAKLKAGDSVDAGAGDDKVYLMISNPDQVALGQLEGGTGSDWLYFTESTLAGGATLSLTTLGATGFENLVGSGANEILQGNSSGNQIAGGGGVDTLYGGDGNDALFAGDPSVAGIEANNVSPDTTNDQLFGGGGNDRLYGSAGNNTLDGGLGADSLRGGSGVDTFILRPGDGGASEALADVIADFQVGIDYLGLDNINYGSLTLVAGTGNFATDTLIRVSSSGEYLAIVKGTTPDAFGVTSFISTSTLPLTFNGTSISEVFVGGFGNDSIYGGGGSDTFSGGSGDDNFSLGGNSGSGFQSSINGGDGTDRVDISYSGISGLGDFALSLSADELSLTDKNGGVITLRSIEDLRVNGKQYVGYLGNYTFDVRSPGYGGKVIWSATESTVFALPGSVFYAGSGWLGTLVGFSRFIGSQGQDTINFNVDRSIFSASYSFNLGAGDDTMLSAKLKAGDSVDAGAGDDKVYLMISNPDQVALGQLEGGTGSDWLYFTESTLAGGATLSLTTLGATGFENLVGSGANEILQGNSSGNQIAGGGGVDTLYGGDGNDALFAGDPSVAGIEANNVSPDTTNDQLFGGGGNDRLYGSAGNNTLDGGLGADSLRGGSGVDTFILRPGDGGASEALADVIADFQDGTDLLYMAGAIGRLSQLTLLAGTGTYAGGTFVKFGAEFLVFIVGVTPSQLTFADFTGGGG